MDLESLGYNEKFENFRREQDLAGFSVGRIAIAHRDRFEVLTEDGELECELTGNLRFTAESKEDLPAVGDWVAITPYDENKGLIHAVYPRNSLIKRKAAGKTSEVQLIGANIDFALIVQAVDRDFNLNRIERYLTISSTSNIEPIVVLTKMDLVEADQRDNLIRQVKQRVKDTLVVAVSSELKDGFNSLSEIVQKGKTYCLLGSSGAGKSTIVNRLTHSNLMKTSAISDSVGKGRHTTTHRELLLLPNGAIMIDNPGMREVGIADSASGLESTFDLITDLASHCHYSDCTHVSEAGCAVLQSLENGELDEATYNNYQKLQREQSHFESSAAEKRQKDKNLGKIIRGYQKMRKQQKF